MRLDLYVLRTVLGGTLVTLGALLGLAVILLLLDEIDKVEGAYTTAKAMLFVLYMLPGYLLEFFPLATLVGSLMALGQLAAGNEITAMRAAGVSLGRLARPVLAAGVLLGLVGMLMGETLGPWGQTQARLMRAEALGHTLSLQGEQGLWLREQERFVHVGYITPSGELHQVRAFAFGPDQTLREALFLEQATPSEQGWEARKVSSNTFRPESVSMAFAETLNLPALVPANLLNVLVVLPQYMSMQELWRYARFLDANGLESAAYWLAWWGKLFAPLQVVAMLLLALPFALVTRRTGGAGQRMVLGILLGLAILILTRLLTQGGLLIGLPAWLAALLPPLLFLALAILGLKRGVV
jgi:lipopolysaccharide export system permease protein